MDRVKRPSSPESQSSSLWVIVGVVVPVLVVMVIVVILYWKLCRTDKLDFQPDTVANIQQRQKVRNRLLPRVPVSVLWTGVGQVRFLVLKDSGESWSGNLLALVVVSLCLHVCLETKVFCSIKYMPRK